MRILLWLAITLVSVLVLFTLAMIISGEDGSLRQSVDGAISDAVLGGLPRSRGERLAERDDPYLITVDRLETDTHHSGGYGYSSHFMTQEVRVTAQPVPAALSWLLSAWNAELDLAPGFEDTVVDVRVRRYAGFFPSVSGHSGLDAMRREGARVLVESLGMTLEERTVTKDLPTLVAGPLFTEKLEQGGHDGGHTIARGPGRLDCLGISREMLIQQIMQIVKVNQIDLPEDDGRRCNVELRWDDQQEGAFEQALADQLDLRVKLQSGEIQLYTIRGPAGPGEG
jgi:hypothetical protein